MTGCCEQGVVVYVFRSQGVGEGEVSQVTDYARRCVRRAVVYTTEAIVVAVHRTMSVCLQPTINALNSRAHSRKATVHTPKARSDDTIYPRR
jgi:hypothetical protein